MAKIIFNDKNYNIDESALTNAINELKSHLSAVMNGEGATINLGGVPYSVDSTKLSTATTDFIAHLGTIAGSGSKVNIGGVEYGVDPAKIAGAISGLNTLLGSLHAEPSMAPGLYQTGAIALFREGNIEDASAMLVTSWEDLEASGAIAISEGDDIELPDMNEYGFYFGVLYSVTMYGTTVAFTFNKDGSAIMSQNGVIQEMPAGTIVYGDHSIDMSAVGLPVLAVSVDGTSMEAEGLTFTIGSGLPPKGTVYLGTVNGQQPQFEGDLILPNDGRATAIADNTFFEQRLLTGVVIPDSVVSIGNQAFCLCSGLTSITVPDGITNIGISAFADCGNLTSITIPDSVTSIGDQAFQNCTSLTSITIPHSVTSIGTYTFYYCTSLTSVTIGNGVTSIGERVFMYCKSLTSITIPHSVTSIGGNTFNACNITSITFTGTQAEWSGIEKNTNWDNGVHATYVQCSDGQVAL